MANGNAPTGLQPRRHRNGAGYAGAVNKYYVPASDNTALYRGDPVVLSGAADARGIAGVVRATAGSGGRITGVVVGFDVDSNAPTSADVFKAGYRAAGVEAYLLVADEPELMFEIQEDSVGGALTAADIGLNADLVAGNGSAATRMSGFMLDTSTKATTATLQLRILGIQQRVDNEIGQYAKVLVAINTPTETGAAGATGV